ncbi:hypothetical protein ENUP19_0257G0047 [Entamoeba nuttalli]|uniref:Uncharacterized protein n=2 Tax=Entamoeba nuttalli TaxID=412467 RepID=K2GTB8_ENTNP|nr:hypothetical protein ENU1_172340 [Entamoeba nuttalli P19]EKE38263.1 hypothetical protein ENU1_172340 [Entamoeba nuttalli P19]|eukprot:XP_008859415.1 hypothetical protein ENU1_172340 [Entamoeba nuttalli P19]
MLVYLVFVHIMCYSKVLFFIGFYCVLSNSITCTIKTGLNEGEYSFNQPEIWTTMELTNSCPCNTNPTFGSECIIVISNISQPIVLNELSGQIGILKISNNTNTTLIYTHTDIYNMVIGNITLLPTNGSSSLYISNLVVKEKTNQLIVEGNYFIYSLETSPKTENNIIRLDSGCIHDISIYNSLIEIRKGPLYVSHDLTNNLIEEEERKEELPSRIENSTIFLHSNQIICKSSNVIDLELNNVKLEFELNSNPKILSTHSVEILNQLSLQANYNGNICVDKVIPIAISSVGSILFDRNEVSLHMRSETYNRLQSSLNTIEIWLYSTDCPTNLLDPRTVSIIFTCLLVISFVVALLLIITYFTFVVISGKVGKKYIELLTIEALGEQEDTSSSEM